MVHVSIAEPLNGRVHDVNRHLSSLLIVLKLLLADIYKEKSRGSAKAMFSVDEVCVFRFQKSLAIFTYVLNIF